MRMSKYRIREVLPDSSTCIRRFDTLCQISKFITTWINSSRVDDCLYHYGFYKLSIEMYSIKYEQWIVMYELVTEDANTWRFQ